MKRLVSKGLVAIVALSVLTACGRPDTFFNQFPDQIQTINTTNYVEQSPPTVISSSYTPDNNNHYGFDYYNVQYQADGFIENVNVATYVYSNTGTMFIRLTHKLNTPDQVNDGINPKDKVKVYELVNTLEGLNVNNANDQKIVSKMVSILQAIK